MIMNIMLLTLMFILGFIFSKQMDLLKSYLENKKNLKEHNKVFIELYDNIINSKLSFDNRVNQNVSLQTNLKDFGKVSIIYLMDREMVCIFKDDKCIYTSDIINKDLNIKIMDKIHEKFGQDINDVVDMLGVIISKKELERNIKEFEKKYPKIDMSLFNKTQNQISEIEMIIEDNKSKFDVDTILDKISRVGMEKLTKEELEFLKSQSNR